MQKSSYKQRRLFFNEKKKKKVSYLLSQYVMYFKIEKRSKRQQVKIYCPYLCYYESLRLKNLSCPMLTSFYSILSHIRLLNPAIRNQEGEEIPINSDQHWIYKSFFVQPKELPIGYCIIISPPSPPPGLTRGLNFSSYPPWRLLKIAFTRPDDFHKIWVCPKEFSEKWKPHPQCKELHIFLLYF